MIRTVALTHEDGRTVTMATAMDFRFLERMFPGWTATEPTGPNDGYKAIRHAHIDDNSAGTDNVGGMERSDAAW